MIETIYALVALLVVQQAYWSWQTHKLIDKLMSRNYAEYVTSKRPLPLKPVQTEPEISDEEILKELNGSVGI